MTEEKKIIKKIKEGDRKAFEYLYTIYIDMIFNTAISYTKNEKDAEEIVQEVFIKIYKNIQSFKGEAKLKTWIYRIVINTSLNYIHKRKRFSIFNKDHFEHESIDFEHPGVILENKENATILFQVMNGLPDLQKTAFILSYIEELPRKEVALIMDTSLKAVESLLQRAKKNMRKKIMKDYPNRRNIKN